MNPSPPTPRRFRFSLRTLLEIIAVAAFVFWIVLYREASLRANGRFVIQPTGDGRSMMVDSQTGRAWVFYSGAGGMNEVTPSELRK